MRYDAANRIMSLSFERDPQEQADVMLEAGHRFMAPPGARYGWPMFFGALAFGVAIGLIMEIYRRFVLAPLLGSADIAPLNIIVLQLLPFLLLIFALLYGRARYITRKRRQALIDRVEPGLFVDTDIFRDGVRTSTGAVTVALEWTAIRNVLIHKTRIEFEGEAFTVYIPERAFSGRTAFEAAAERIRALWQDAIRKRQLATEDASVVVLGGEDASPLQ